MEHEKKYKDVKSLLELIESNERLVKKARDCGSLDKHKEGKL